MVERRGTTMGTARRALASGIVFGLAGLVGPALQWAALLVFGRGGLRTTALEDVVSDAIFLLWPAHSIAVIEAAVGPLVATGVAVGANALIFASIGIAAGLAATRRMALLFVFLIVLGLLVWLESWRAGFDWEYVSLWALFISLLVQGALFSLAAKVTRAPGEVAR